MVYDKVQGLLDNLGNEPFHVLWDKKEDMEILFNLMVNRLKRIINVEQEKDDLLKKLEHYRHTRKQLACSKQQVKDLEHQLQISRNIAASAEQDRSNYIEQLKTMELINKDREFVSKDLLYYQHECIALRKKNKDMEESFSEKNRKLQMKVHVLVAEVEKLKKEKQSILKQKDTTEIYNKEKISNQGKQMLEMQRKCRDVEGQLKKTAKELKLVEQAPKIEVIVHKVSEDEVAMEFFEAQKLRKHLIKEKNKLLDMERQMKRKDVILAEKEKECEDLKHNMPLWLPNESLEEMPNCKRTIRSQQKKINALTGAKNMYQVKAEEYMAENEKLTDRAERMRKFYLKERMKNYDLMEFMKKQVGEIKSDVTEQQEPDQIKKPCRLPHIAGLDPLQPAPTRPKGIVYLSAKTSAAPKQNILYKQDGKHAVLPPINAKPLTTQKHEPVFLTETDD